MSPFSEVEEFVVRHRNCGGSTFDANAPTRDGYKLNLRCRCGIKLERWITPLEAERDLLWSRLLGFEN